MLLLSWLLSLLLLLLLPRGVRFSTSLEAGPRMETVWNRKRNQQNYQLFHGLPKKKCIYFDVTFQFFESCVVSYSNLRYKSARKYTSLSVLSHQYHKKGNAAGKTFQIIIAFVFSFPFSRFRQKWSEEGGDIEIPSSFSLITMRFAFSSFREMKCLPRG